ncbi:hypothetical protein SASPL_140771 [Salvia splendens]|uniref:RHOMBOID-like protein n=1 Tax=Salvia splendens TaxID=180675 RepID=A0A8X8WQZ0_SALSN|nr:hypothetical protein SASPL_140771 [Salvia splendens]
MKSQRQIRVYLSCNLHQTMINKHVLRQWQCGTVLHLNCNAYAFSIQNFLNSNPIVTFLAAGLGFTVARGREEKRRMIGNGDPERGAPRKHRNQSYYAGGVGNYDMDSHDTYWTSWLVPMIVLANVAMFVVIMFVNNCPKNHDGLHGDCVAKFLRRLSFQPLRQNPLFGPSSSTLEKLGALEWDKIVHQNQAWRLFTCIWLHAGVIHLLANMLSLVFIGIRLEQQFGFCIGGSILSSLFIRNNISVGASGALFGLLGAMLPALFTLIVIIAINLAVGILPHVDNFAHIGGFLSGFLLGFILLARPQFGWLEGRNRPADTRLKSKYNNLQWDWVMLFKGENANNKCSWCHYTLAACLRQDGAATTDPDFSTGPAQGALGRVHVWSSRVNLYKLVAQIFNTFGNSKATLIQCLTVWLMWEGFVLSSMRSRPARALAWARTRACSYRNLSTFRFRRMWPLAPVELSSTVDVPKLA